MPLWGANNETADSPLYTPAQVKLSPNSANRDNLFNNATPDAFITNETVGVWGVSDDVMNSSGVASISTDVAGSGYTARPTVSIAAFDGPTGINATATAVGILVTATVNNAGTGGSYVPGDILTTGTGSPTKGTVNVTATEIRTASPHTGNTGTGFANGDTVTVSDGTMTVNAVFTVTTGAANTSVASLTLTNRGSFTTNPTLTNGAATVKTGSGTGLFLDVTMRVKTVAIVNAGAYTTLPTLAGDTPTGGSGTGASLDYVIGAGPVTMTDHGAGYLTAPTVTYGGTGGSGSSGTAVLGGAGNQQGVAHAGWNLRHEGTGGRAGRVWYETLVAMSDVTGNDSELP